LSEQSPRLERARKPASCPICKKSPMGSILYGYPAFSPDLERQLEKGSIVLGGCCPTMDDPAWECSRCGQQIYKKKKGALTQGTLAFTTGSFMCGGYSIKLMDEEILIMPFSMSPNSPDDVKAIKPSLAEWRIFWSKVETLGVWKWKSSHHDPGIEDGSYWELELNYGGKSKKSEGINSYPKTFDSFVKALERLLGDSILT
jgi:hypothetical protein